MRASRSWSKSIVKLNLNNYFNSCESFCLTAPYKPVFINLEISTPTGIIEDLVNQLRRNIFKIPDSANFNISPLPEIETIQGTTKNLKSQGKAKITQNKKRKIVIKKDSDDLELDNYLKRTSANLDKNRNADLVMLKIIEESETRPDYIEDEYDVSGLSLQSESNQSKQFSMLKEDENELLEKNSSKFSLKKATCEACVKNLTNPRPTPKTQTIKKGTIPKLDDSLVQAIKTESMHKLAEIIDKGKNRLMYYERAFGKKQEERISFNKMKSMQRGSFIRNNSVEIVDLDDLDLAKIRQEIREKETKKKLDSFLEKQAALLKK